MGDDSLFSWDIDAEFFDANARKSVVPPNNLSFHTGDVYNIPLLFLKNGYISNMSKSSVISNK
jgi:hypothetical protein